MGKIRKEINELPFLNADLYAFDIRSYKQFLGNKNFDTLCIGLHERMEKMYNSYNINPSIFYPSEVFSFSYNRSDNEKRIDLSLEKTILKYINMIFYGVLSIDESFDYECSKQKLFELTKTNDMKSAIYELFLNSNNQLFNSIKPRLVRGIKHIQNSYSDIYNKANSCYFDFVLYLKMDNVAREKMKRNFRKIFLRDASAGSVRTVGDPEDYINCFYREVDLACLMLSNQDQIIKEIKSTFNIIYNNYDKIEDECNNCSIHYYQLSEDNRVDIEFLNIYGILDVTKILINARNSINKSMESENNLLNKIDNKIIANLLYILDFFTKNNLTSISSIIEFKKNNKSIKHGNDDLIELFNIFNDLIKDVPSVKKIYDNLPDLKTNRINVYKAMVENYINESIASLNSESVDKSEIEETIDSLKEEIRVNNLGKQELNKKKQQLLRLNLVFEEIPPNAIQKGLGAFKKYYVYYYESGMVALDIIDEYGALYIMPITVYNYIIKNDIQKRSVIQSLPGVNHFSHSTTSKTWKEEAKDLIINGVEELSDEDIMINSNVDYWNFKYDLSNYDRIKNDINNNTELSDEEKENSINIIKTYESEERIKQEQIIQKRKEKIEQAKEIDKELKESEPESDVLPDQIQADEDELELQGEGLSFQELFEASKKIDKKAKRSAAVSKYCKDRTMDMEGLYHCECCGETISPEEKYMLDTHHLKPISEGGPDTIYNAVCLCNQCHRTIHRMPERVTPNVILKLLDTIERHLIDENPEFLEEFYDYKKQFFTETTLNDKIIQKRNELNDTITNEKELDEQVEKYAEQLSKEYENKNDIHRIIDNNFAMNWHNSDVIIK